jgi:hypothetical protein
MNKIYIKLKKKIIKFFVPSSPLIILTSKFKTNPENGNFIEIVLIN